jgi:site-specific recombinase XerD
MQAKIEVFLTDLAIEGRVSASTQNQAFHALLFRYRYVLRMELSEPIDALRAKKSQRLPVVLTKAEGTQVLDRRQGQQRLMAQRLYGTGMRMMACLRLRVQDVDFCSSRNSDPRWQGG